MYQVNGFKTKEEAKAFQREYGGIVLWAEYTPKRHKLTRIGYEYDIAMKATGIDRKKYPFIVERRI